MANLKKSALQWLKMHPDGSLMEKARGFFGKSVEAKVRGAKSDAGVLRAIFENPKRFSTAKGSPAKFVANYVEKARDFSRLHLETITNKNGKRQRVWKRNGDAKSSDGGNGGGKPPYGKLRGKVVAELRGETGKPIANKKDKFIAQLSIAGINKMTSDAAIAKSRKNGFSPEQHLSACRKIVALFRGADFVASHGNVKNPDDKNTKIRRYVAHPRANGEKCDALITVKENVIDGNRIYSLELNELNKASQRWEVDENAHETSAVSKIPPTNPHDADNIIPQKENLVKKNPKKISKLRQGLKTPSAIAEYMKKMLEKVGYDVSEHGSGSSSSEYLRVENLNDSDDFEPFEIRIADHDLPPTYDRMYLPKYDVRAGDNIYRGGTAGNAQSYDTLLADLLDAAGADVSGYYAREKAAADKIAAFARQLAAERAAGKAADDKIIAGILAEGGEAAAEWTRIKGLLDDDEHWRDIHGNRRRWARGKLRNKMKKIFLRHAKKMGLNGEFDFLGNFILDDNKITKALNGKEKSMEAKNMTERERFLRHKAAIMEVLRRLAAKERREDGAMEKAFAKAEARAMSVLRKARGFAIGTTSIWNGKKFRKVAQHEWRRVYEGDGRGARASYAALLKRCAKIDGPQELADFIRANVGRFRNEEGELLRGLRDVYDDLRKMKGEGGAGHRERAARIAELQKKNAASRYEKEAEAKREKAKKTRGDFREIVHRGFVDAYDPDELYGAAERKEAKADFWKRKIEKMVKLRDRALRNLNELSPDMKELRELAARSREVAYHLHSQKLMDFAIALSDRLEGGGGGGRGGEPPDDVGKKVAAILANPAEKYPDEIEFSRENYDRLFKNGVQTPLEKVKIGEHQFEKIKAKNRTDILAPMHDTLSNPSVVAKTDGGAKLYAKSYDRDGKAKAFVSVVVKKDGISVSISTHREKIEQIAKKSREILYEKDFNGDDGTVRGVPRSRTGDVTTARTSIIPQNENPVNSFSQKNEKNLTKSELIKKGNDLYRQIKSENRDDFRAYFGNDEHNLGMYQIFYIRSNNKIQPFDRAPTPTEREFLKTQALLTKEYAKQDIENAKDEPDSHDRNVKIARANWRIAEADYNLNALSATADPPESAAEEHRNRSEAMKGNKNAWKGGAEEEDGFDRHGNPLNPDGSYKIEKSDVADLTDADFANPTRNVELPEVSAGLRNVVGEKPFLIKKSVFAKNAENHPELSPAQSRRILQAALYETEIAGQSQPRTRPNYFVAIKTADDDNSLCVFEVNEKKTRNEIVGWRKIDNRGIEKLERQAEREDGQLLILTPKGAAAALSTLPHGRKNDSADGRKSQAENEKKSREADFDALKARYAGGVAAYGDEDEIILPSGERVEGRWALVEADAPSASHDEVGFFQTAGFPQNPDGSTINDRDYEHDEDAREAVLRIANNFDARALSQDSPVVVSQDGVVVSGNNRTMSSKLAAKHGTDGAYIARLEKIAGRFGLDAAEVKKMRHPRVVFETPIKEYSTALFAKFNENATKTQGPVEKAVKASKLLTTEAVSSIADKMQDFETLGDLYADRAACAAVFKALLECGAVGEMGLAEYYSGGAITNAGKEFVETALVGSVLSPQNVRAVSQDGTKSIRQKLVRAIVPLVNNRGQEGYSIQNELNLAVSLCAKSALEKKSIENLQRERVLFGEKTELPEVALRLAKELQGTQKGFAEYMSGLDAALSIGAEGQADLFLGRVETKDEILSRFLRKSLAALASIREKIRSAKSA